MRKGVLLGLLLFALHAAARYSYPWVPDWVFETESGLSTAWTGLVMVYNLPSWLAAGVCCESLATGRINEVPTLAGEWFNAGFWLLNWTLLGALLGGLPAAFSRKVPPPARSG